MKNKWYIYTETMKHKGYKHIYTAANIYRPKNKKVIVAYTRRIKMNEFRYVMCGLCFGVGCVCMITGSPVMGGINLLLAVLNYYAAKNNV